MGRYSFQEDCEIMLPLTLVLVGKTGNGKSATGNSILGMQMFQSKRSLSAVTRTSMLKTTEIEDGQPLNVIDTPGLFDSSLDFEFTKKEIVNCINMAKDGFDAFLVVISVCNRFAEDEQAAISSMLSFFGRKFYDYMIIVFTNGDGLEDDDESLEDFLSNSPEALQETLRFCKNRCVLFDNKTKDPTKRSNQLQKLLCLVNMVSKSNGGKPYTNELFTELKFESRLKETTLKLEQLLTEERTARLKSEKNAQIAQKKSDEEIQKICMHIGCQFDSKLKETTLKLKLLTEEQTAWLIARENAGGAQNKLDGEIEKKSTRQLEEQEMLEFEEQFELAYRISCLHDCYKDALKKSDTEIFKLESKLKWTEEHAKAAQKIQRTRYLSRENS